MTYPPPPGLVLMAYAFGKITKSELDYYLKLWNEKHAERLKEGVGNDRG